VTDSLLDALTASAEGNEAPVIDSFSKDFEAFENEGASSTKKRKISTKIEKERAKNDDADMRVSRLAAMLVSATRDAQFDLLESLESEPVLDASVVRRYRTRLRASYDKFFKNVEM
jgi:hypothetical protein